LQKRLYVGDNSIVICIIRINKKAITIKLSEKNIVLKKLIEMTKEKLTAIWIILFIDYIHIHGKNPKYWTVLLKRDRLIFILQNF